MRGNLILYKDVPSNKYIVLDKETKKNIVKEEKMFYAFKKLFCEWKSNSEEIVFRGQSNAEWKLEPSLFRENYVNLLEEEEEYYKTILSDNPHEFKDMNENVHIMYNLEFQSKIQHYGCPTRLLDVSSNPYKALGFMVESLGNEEVLGKTSCLYFLKLKNKSNKIFMSSLLKEEEIKDKLSENKYPLIIPSNNQSANVRLHAQSGQFIWIKSKDKKAGKNKDIEKELEEFYEITKVDVKFSDDSEIEEIKQKLNEYHYSIEDLYPDLIKKAEYYKNKWKK